MKYYVAENEQPVGPFEVSQLIARGLKGTDLVWTEGLEGWVTAESVEEIRMALYAPNGSSQEYRETAIPEINPAQNTQCPPPPFRPAYAQPAQPTQPHAAGFQQQVDEIPPKNWLLESILVTILCCLPFGIVGIIKASSVNSLWMTGQYDNARKASADAKRWTIIGLCCGLVWIILYAIFWVTIGFASVLSEM